MTQSYSHPTQQYHYPYSAYALGVLSDIELQAEILKALHEKPEEYGAVFRQLPVLVGQFGLNKERAHHIAHQVQQLNIPKTPQNQEAFNYFLSQMDEVKPIRPKAHRPPSSNPRPTPRRENHPTSRLKVPNASASHHKRLTTGQQPLSKGIHHQPEKSEAQPEKLTTTTPDATVQPVAAPSSAEKTSAPSVGSLSLDSGEAKVRSKEPKSNLNTFSNKAAIKKPKADKPPSRLITLFCSVLSGLLFVVIIGYFYYNPTNDQDQAPVNQFNDLTTAGSANTTVADLQAPDISSTSRINSTTSLSLSTHATSSPTSGTDTTIEPTISENSVTTDLTTGSAQTSSNLISTNTAINKEELTTLSTDQKEAIIQEWFEKGDELAQKFHIGPAEEPDRALYYLEKLKKEAPNHPVTAKLLLSIADACRTWGGKILEEGDERMHQIYIWRAEQYEREADKILKLSD